MNINQTEDNSKILYSFPSSFSLIGTISIGLLFSEVKCLFQTSGTYPKVKTKQGTHKQHNIIELETFNDLWVFWLF